MEETILLLCGQGRPCGVVAVWTAQQSGVWVHAPRAAAIFLKSATEPLEDSRRVLLCSIVLD